MIDKVSFSGRETMLTIGLEKAAQQTQQVVKAYSVLPELQIAAEKVKPVRAEYTSPFASTGNAVKDVVSNVINRNGLNFFA